jgi:hypothetical protein
MHVVVRSPQVIAVCVGGNCALCGCRPRVVASRATSVRPNAIVGIVVSDRALIIERYQPTLSGEDAAAGVSGVVLETCAPRTPHRGVIVGDGAVGIVE